MTNQRPRHHPSLNQPTTSTWAPWWLYLAAVIGGNHLRRLVLADASTRDFRVIW